MSLLRRAPPSCCLIALLLLCHGICRAEVTVQVDSTDLSVFVSISPDGNYVVTGIRNIFKPIYVLDAENGNIIREIHPDFEGVQDFYQFDSLAISPDSKWIATGCSDGSVRCWALETGRLVYRILLVKQKEKLSFVKSMAFSTNGRYLVAGGRHFFCVVDFKDEPKATILSPTETTAVAYIPGKDAFVGAGWKVLVFDAEGKFEIGAMKYRGRSAYIRCIAFSPDGKRGAIAESGKPIKIIDAESAEELMQRGGTPEITNVPRTVAFSPDGQEFATPTSETLTIWRTEDGKELNSIGPLKEKIVSFAYLPSGVSAAIGDGGGSVSLWDVKQNKRVWELKIPIERLSDKQRRILYEFEFGKRK